MRASEEAAWNSWPLEGQYTPHPRFAPGGDLIYEQTFGAPSPAHLARRTPNGVTVYDAELPLFGVEDFTLDPQGNVYAIGYGEGAHRLLRVDSAGQVSPLWADPEDSIQAVEFANNSLYVLRARERYNGFYNWNDLLELDPETGTISATLRTWGRTIGQRDMYARPAALVVYHYFNAEWIDYDGTTITTHGFDGDGTSFAPLLDVGADATVAHASQCGSNKQIEIAGIDGTTWNTSAAGPSGCGSIPTQVLSDGRVVTASLEGNQLSVHTFSSSGELKTTSLIQPAQGETFSDFDLVADGQGAAALALRVQYPCDACYLSDAGLRTDIYRVIAEHIDPVPMPWPPATQAPGSQFVAHLFPTADNGSLALFRQNLIKNSNSQHTVGIASGIGFSRRWWEDPTLSSGPGGPEPPSLGQPVPRPTDELLQRQLPVTVNNQTARIEYGWARSAEALAPDEQPYQTCADFTSCVLDYRDTSPDDTWYLFARALDSRNRYGSWSDPLALNTPRSPILIALGDSVTSGHHKDSDGELTTCDDDRYSFGRYAHEKMNAALPAVWRTSDYFNLAHSGFSTEAVRDGNTPNACGTFISESPLTTAKALLAGRSNSWNRVLVSAGIDDTNWTDVVARIVRNYFLTPIYTESSCASDLNTWNGWDRANAISSGVSQIISGLRNADPTSRVDWLRYYQISGTGPVPRVCSDPMAVALQYMNDVILERGFSTYPVETAHIDELIGGRSEYLQKFYPSDFQTGLRAVVYGHVLSGWPHPNTAGAMAISSIIAP